MALVIYIQVTKGHDCKWYEQDVKVAVT